jgi:hypothetical protein
MVSMSKVANPFLKNSSDDSNAPPITEVNCVVQRPPTTHDFVFDKTRNRTWGGYFNVDGALEAANACCFNITAPITLSLAEGARPYYTFSQSITYETVTSAIPTISALTATSDWMNIIFTVNEGCELHLTSYYCYQRFWDIFVQCGSTVGYSTLWNGGGMLSDSCGQFYMTAGAELTGYLWGSPLTDMTSSAGWQ